MVVLYVIAHLIINDLARLNQSGRVVGLLALEADVEGVSLDVIELISIYVVPLVAHYIEEPLLLAPARGISLDQC
jgi:hypothetical protein